MRFSRIFVAGFLCATAALGQEKSTTPPADLLLKIDPVESPRLVTEPLKLHVVVIARTPKVVDLQQLRWEVPEQILRGESDETVAGQADPKKRRGWMSPQQRPEDVPTVLNDPYPYTFELPTAGFDWSCLAFWSKVQRSPRRSFPLFFNGAKYTIKVHAEAAENPLSQNTTPADSELEIEFLPSPFALVLGGLTGVLLLAILEGLTDLYRRVKGVSWPQHSDGRLNWAQVRRSANVWLITRFVDGIAQLLLGACVVIIFFVLVGIGQGYDLPVNFKVNGFFSAIGVGLCMHLLAAKMYERFVPGAAENKTPKN